MKKLLLTLLLGASLLSVGCAKEKVTNPTSQPQEVEEPTEPVTTLPVTPDGTGGTGVNGGFGATADLQVVNNNTLEDFLTKPTNTPQNIQVYVDLQENSDQTFSGRVSIYVTDRGVTRSYNFETGSQRHSGFNKFILNDSAFHAVLDDGDAGMLVFVIDDIVDLGDGNGAEPVVGGRVFFYNYPIIYGHGGRPQAQHPQEYGYDSYCWEIKAGPYQCKPWKSLSESSLEIWPTGNMKLLGSFNNLNINRALNLN